MSFKDEQDINAVTGLLKLYFRELRNPLMTHEYYDWFIEAASKVSDKCKVYLLITCIRNK